jgi:penicillin-binding protein 2
LATILPPSGSIARPEPGWDVADRNRAKNRVYFCSILIAVAFVGLLARLYYLQIVEGDRFLARAQRNRLETVSLQAPRGLILDRSGVPLAVTQTAHSISVVPKLLPSARREKEERDRLLGTLAFLLETTPEAIEKRLDEAKKFGPFDPVPIAENVDLTTITRIEENASRLSGAILVTDDLKRYYPQGSLASHMMGYTGVVNERDLEKAKARGKKFAFDDKIGKSGIERFYDAEVRGKRGATVFEVDAKGKPIRVSSTTPDVPGATIHLTLDVKLQKAAETALANARNNGAVAVVDPRNGEVLALASRPIFDPNIFSLPRKEFSAKYRAIAANKNKPLLNRAVTSALPPGSTFKPVTAAAGLEKGVVSTSWSVNCPGYYKFGRRFGCDGVHGSENMDQAMAHSCNVYFYQLSLKMGNPSKDGPNYLASVAHRFGLGQETGIDLPIDGAGNIPDTEWRKRVNKTRPDLAVWQPGSTLNMSIGQGDVMATPLQMALMTAAIANGGTLYKPHIMRKIVDSKGKIIKQSLPEGQSVGISPRNISIVRAGMRSVVTSGTGKRSNLPNVKVAGKTGSAEDARNALPHAWWICFAPYDKPTIAIAALIENSGHGSENALPVAKAILEAAFPIVKDDQKNMKVGVVKASSH